jgi:hypothetical protein
LEGRVSVLGEGELVGFWGRGWICLVVEGTIGLWIGMQRYREFSRVYFDSIYPYTWAVIPVEAILSDWWKAKCVCAREKRQLELLAKWEEHFQVPLFAPRFRLKEETVRPIEQCSFGFYTGIHEKSMPLPEDDLVEKTSTREHPPKIQRFRNSKF